MGKDEMLVLAGLIERVVAAPHDDPALERVAREVDELTRGFPAPGILQS
jgi:hypothetical protein